VPPFSNSFLLETAIVGCQCFSTLRPGALLSNKKLLCAAGIRPPPFLQIGIILLQLLNDFESAISHHVTAVRNLPALFVLLPHFPLVFVALSMILSVTAACTLCEGVQLLPGFYQPE
jgi:hypothetical protein